MLRPAYVLFILLFTIISTISCSSKNASQSPNSLSDSNSPYTAEKVEISDNISGYEQTLPQEPAPTVPDPLVTSEDILLGSFQTVLLSKDKERVDNIKLAVSKINGCRILPGKVFSFNYVVGKRTARNGFKTAAVIINGEYDEGIGGGICQLSSTLYNAADKAGLKIIERHSHTRQVAYVPRGRDATVSYGYLDLKFKNTKNFPVILRAKVENGRVYAFIYKAQ